MQGDGESRGVKVKKVKREVDGKGNEDEKYRLIAAVH